jgi:putative hydrolase of the HAD superfamily
VDSYAAYLVDLDGTLYEAPKVKLAMFGELALYGWRSLATLRRFRLEHEHQRRTQAEPDDSPYRRQIENTARALGVPAQDVERCVHEWMIVRPARWLRRFRRESLLGELQAFKAGGGLIAVVSDYPAQVKLEALGQAGLFDVVVANGEPQGPRWLKPHPDGFLRAAERLQVPVERCLVLGDRADADGEAARRAGMAFRHIL